MRIKCWIKSAASMLYRICPVIVQNLVVSLYGIIIYLQRYGKMYRKYLSIYSTRDYSSYKKNKQFQNREFIRLLHFAVKHSEFYRRLYKDIDLSQIKSVDDIAKLPILTKKDFKENLNKIYTIPSSKGIKLHTGGTTGIPVMILTRRNDLQKRMAYLDAFKLEYGFRVHEMRCARFIGKNIVMNEPHNHIFWRNNYFSKLRYYSTYHLIDKNMIYYVNNLNEFQPEAIEVYVSAIYWIAKYINDNEITLKFIPRAVFTTAETILPVHREMIERVFRCPVRDQYASNDGAPFIKQCRYGTYHENIDTGVFEHIETARGIKLLVTSFFSYGTPLIRYDIGDYILESEEKGCPCEAFHPIIAAVDGRTNDFIQTQTRGNISQAALSTIISELPDCIEQLQLIQENIYLIRVKVVIKDVPRIEEFLSFLKGKFSSYLGEDMELIVERVGSMEREKSGKFRLILNHMEESVD